MQTTLLPGYCESFGKFRAIFRFFKIWPCENGGSFKSLLPAAKFTSSSLISLQAIKISMAHTMWTVSTLITHPTRFIQTSVLTTPMIGSGTGFCAADSDGKFTNSCSEFQRLTMFLF
jgi:hypothetical protein